MSINDALFILLRRNRPETVINNWLNANADRVDKICSSNTVLSFTPNKEQFAIALQNHFPQYSSDEAEILFRYMVNSDGFDFCGVFGLIPKAVEDCLITDSHNECLCRYKKLIKFRELSYPIDPMIFVSAYLAKYDIDHNFGRTMFSWPTIVRSDNDRLHRMLDGGMSENHFHIGGSTDAFIFSWICLMNHFSADRKEDFSSANMDKNPLDTVFMGGESSLSCFSLAFKAACIRLFLFHILNHIPTDEFVNREWLEEMLELPEGGCEIFCQNLDSKLSAMREVFSFPDKNFGFCPDYAIYNEPYASEDEDLKYIHIMAVRNYERKLFRPISGEQRFQYSLFKAIFAKDPDIMGYLDIAYAYLLIYCQIRGELMQINRRVGFANFLQYQDRKDIFTDRFPKYDKMRTKIATQLVLKNPQVVSFEGRLIPADTSKALHEKLENIIKQTKDSDDSPVSDKLNLVLHFAKKSQEISLKEENELINPRDSILRIKNNRIADAIIEATINHPDTMQYVTAIDACSDEINCRPEVFAPAFRKIRNHRREHTDSRLITVPVMRITYHAGEDFFDPIDGMRAIDEAISFCEMKTGDRLGHAMALGIDCREWYAFKKNCVILRKQDFLDNMVWLYGKMHQYGCFSSKAEDYIQKQFKKLFTEIYTSNLDRHAQFSRLYSVDLSDYYMSLGLRGNDPWLYMHNPEENDICLESIVEAESEENSWKIRKGCGSDYDPLSITLYHYYHFDYKMKLKANEPMRYQVPKEIVDVVCEVQNKMLYDVADKHIGIECNPSSNYLIGTFKDYMKHPIFRFNNRGLYPQGNEKFDKNNPYICASINTDDLGIFGTSLENEYALMACALENHNDYCDSSEYIPPDNIYRWLDEIRKNCREQSFIRINDFSARRD